MRSKFMVGLYLVKDIKSRQVEFDSEIKTPGGVCFYGDSITYFCDLNKFYPGLKTYNRGICGDSARYTVKRMEKSMDGLSPDLIVLLIGVNDMMNLHRTPEKTAKLFEKVLCKLKSLYPDTNVIVQSPYPGWDGNPPEGAEHFPIAYLAPDIKKLGELYKEITARFGYIYADVHSVLAMEDGVMYHEYSIDGCHPTEAGYKAVAEYLRPIIDAALNN